MNNEKTISNYEEFKAKYLSYFKLMISYSPDRVGSAFYLEKMAALADQYPEWADRAENENT